MPCHGKPLHLSREVGCRGLIAIVVTRPNDRLDKLPKAQPRAAPTITLLSVAEVLDPAMTRGTASAVRREERQAFPVTLKKVDAFVVEATKIAGAEALRRGNVVVWDDRVRLDQSKRLRLSWIDPGATRRRQGRARTRQ